MKQNSLIVTFVFAIFFASNTYALPTKVTSLQSCKIIGVVPLKEYVTRTQRSCFKKKTSAEAKNLKPYSNQSAKAVSRADRNNPCNYLSVNSLQVYFSTRQLKCFTSERNAKGHNFIKLVLPTPTPTATVVVTIKSIPEATVTPTPTPTTTPVPFVADPAYSWDVVMGPAGETGVVYHGKCQAAFNTDHSAFRYACQTDFTSNYESHIEQTTGVVGKWCIHPLPSTNFEQICPIVTDNDRMWAQVIMDEKTIISIHLAKGAANQALAGRISRD